MDETVLCCPEAAAVSSCAAALDRNVVACRSKCRSRASTTGSARGDLELFHIVRNIARYDNCPPILGFTRRPGFDESFLRLIAFCLMTVSAIIPGERSGNWSAKVFRVRWALGITEKGTPEPGRSLFDIQPRVGDGMRSGIGFLGHGPRYGVARRQQPGLRDSDHRRPSGPLHSVPGRARAAPESVWVPGVDRVQPKDQPARK